MREGGINGLEVNLDSPQSPTLFHTVINKLPTHIWSSSPQGARDYSNDTWFSYTGLSNTDDQQSAAHPDDLPNLTITWNASLADGKPGECQARMRRHDGVFRWFLLRWEPLVDATGAVVGWCGTNTDIDDLKRVEANLRDEERELRRITDAISQTLGVLDPAGAVLYANQATLDYTGLTLADISAPNFRNRMFHPDDLARLAVERKSALERGIPFEFEQRALRKDGQYRWFLIRYSPFRDDAGRLIRWYVAGTDIQELKRTESLLESERDRLRLLLEVQQALVSNLDLETLFRSLASRLRNVTGCDLIGLSMPDPATGQLRQRLVDQRESRGNIAQGLVVPLHGSASGKAFRTQKLVYLDGAQGEVPPEEIYDTPEGKRFYSLLLEEGIPSGYFLPLVTNGQSIAVIQLTKYAGGKFKTQQSEFLEALAGQLSIAVANSLEHGALAAERDQLEREQIYLREEVERASMFEEIVGSSDALRKVLSQVSKVAPTNSTVLILGETGTGKELLARAIHNRSTRSKRAFIRVNCAAIPPALVASELFGHEKGSFTGALQRRVGRFELADLGTIFLDEVGELPPETQVALLRVLQEREFERVGGSQTISVDVRVIAATNRNLEAAISESDFRQDLFYRLNVFPIRVPPLRERTDDIPLLVGYLINRFSQNAGKKLRRIDKRTMDLFRAYAWPGNIRELQNVVERAVVLSEGETFSIDEAWLTHVSAEPQTTQPAQLASLTAREREMIERALEHSKGVIGGPNGAASKLGIPRQTLESKIRKLGINRHRYR